MRKNFKSMENNFTSKQAKSYRPFLPIYLAKIVFSFSSFEKFILYFVLRLLSGSLWSTMIQGCKRHFVSRKHQKLFSPDQIPSDTLFSASWSDTYPRDLASYPDFATAAFQVSPVLSLLVLVKNLSLSFSQPSSPLPSAPQLRGFRAGSARRLLPPHFNLFTFYWPWKLSASSS